MKQRLKLLHVGGSAVPSLDKQGIRVYILIENQNGSVLFTQSADLLFGAGSDPNRESREALKAARAPERDEESTVMLALIHLIYYGPTIMLP